MIILGLIVKAVLALGMIGFIVILCKAIVGLCKSPKNQQINIKINFQPEQPENSNDTLKY